jgi:hypothetical protein
MKRNGKQRVWSWDGSEGEGGGQGYAEQHMDSPGAPSSFLSPKPNGSIPS